MHGRVRSWSLVAVVTVAALVLAIAPASGELVVQDQSPIKAAVMVQEGTLVAKGVAADVVVEYQCAEHASLDYLAVDVRQRFGTRVAIGSGWVPGSELEPCLGFVTHTVTVRVYPWDTRFKPGSALVSAYLYGYDYYSWFTVSDEREIRLSPH